VAQSSRRITVIIVSIAVVVAGTVGVVALTRSGGSRHQETGESAGSHEMREALEKRPTLASHRMPLAFVSEKLEQQGGEASGEVKNGPAQEAYDQRAYPRKSIGPAQQKGAARSFGQARQRAATAQGKSVLRTAQGARAVQAWTPAGPEGGVQLKETSYTGTPAYVSGRTTSLVTGYGCTASRCTLFAGTAGGGLWKTRNALAAHPTWTHIGSDIPSTAIGSVYRAPNGDLYVGTGEPNGSSDSEAGLGLFRSTDNGAHFSRLSTFAGGTDFTVNRSVAAVAVDPSNARHIMVGTAVARHGSSSVNGGRFTPPGAAKVGLYETRDGGSTWQLTLSQDTDSVDPSSPTGADYFRGGISKIQFDPTHRGIAFASMFDYGLFRESTAGAWKQIYTIKTPGDPVTGLDSRVEFALATLASGKTRIYLGDATYFDDIAAALLRSDDGTASKPTFRLLSDPAPGTPGYGSYNFCQGQCSYDMAVTTPPNKPNEVFLSGSMNYDELQAFGGPGSSNGRSIVRSDDAGVHVTDMTNDAQSHPNGLHPDEHALVFVNTGSRQTFFSASDGGIWRQQGPYVDRSSECVARGLVGPTRVDCEQYLSKVPTLNQSLNKGLETLQFQSASVTSGANGIIQGGTQDNGTWESDQSGFAETIGGDGGQSAFNPTNDKIRYHSYYAPQHDVSFDSGSPRSWDWIADPLLESGEAASFYVPLTADPVVGGTVFDGLQHVWRTTDNGGSRAFLDKYCNEISGDFANAPRPCGDWKKLGGNAGDLSGGDPDNYVVAVERAASDHGTLWAGTRKGGLYVSTNADAASPGAVTYQRYDTKLGLPKRFPSGIWVDPAKPNHAYLSYSGYSAYSPGGHVYEVTVNPATGNGTAKDLSANLGDQPVTDVVAVPSTGALYVSTDFGVLTRVRGQSNWVATTGLPQVAVYGLALDPSRHTLYAATHGRSIWRLPVG
jgi:hypothetical protein